MSGNEGGNGGGGRAFFTAFIAGLAAGAAAALLLAPAKGESTRKQLVARVSSAYAGAVAQAARAGETAASARFQIDRLFASVAAGIDEARVVRAQLESSYIDDEVSRRG
ncbi:MAG TPA: YtxH domain-containing protein [bacterium]|nr:YtxH domain-containing protein [bacterium]